jgi:hypothetical protein
MGEVLEAGLLGLRTLTAGSRVKVLPERRVVMCTVVHRHRFDADPDQDTTFRFGSTSSFMCCIRENDRKSEIIFDSFSQPCQFTCFLSLSKFSIF